MDVDILVSMDVLPEHLRQRVPQVDGRWIVTDGEAAAGCLIGSLPTGELVYLVGPDLDRDDLVTVYTGWVVVSDRLPEIEGGGEA